MYYTIKNNINFLSLESIFCGIEKELFSPDIAVEYANYYAMNNSNDVSPEMVKLMILDSVKKDEVLAIISDYAPKTRKNLNNSLRKLRYIVLLELWQTEKDIRKLSSILDEVYADFDYPTDMDSFVSYMPVNDEYDVSLHSEEENVKRLINNFEIFMQNEEKWLLNGDES